MDSDTLHNHILIAIELYNYKNLSDKSINILPLLKKEFVYQRIVYQIVAPDDGSSP